MSNENDSLKKDSLFNFTRIKQTHRKIKVSITVFIKVLSFAIVTVFKSGPFLLLFLVLTTILAGLMPTATVVVGKLVLNAIINVLQTGAGNSEVFILARILILQLIILGIGELIGQSNTYLNYMIGRRLSVNMSADVIKKASKLDYAFFENSYFYDVMTRAKKESTGKPLILVLKVTSIIRNCITFISMGGLVASFSLLLFLAMLVFCLPLLLIKLRYGAKNYSMLFNRTEDMRMAEYISDIMLTKQNIPEIMSFGLWKYLFGRWHSAAHKFLDQDTQLYRKLAISQTVAAISMACSTAAATGYIIYISTIKAMPLTVGDIMMYSGAFAGGLVSLRAALDSVSGVYESSLFLRNFIEFSELQPQIEVRKKEKLAPSVIETIELQNVSFKYPNSSCYALKNVSVTFSKSQSTLLVGANGAGKTTLIKLLTRLYDPTEGKILLNGEDLRKFEIESLRKAVGVIFQEFIRYAFTVKENIACGDITELQNIKKINIASIRAKADSFIKQLPQQYDTTLSRIFENGQELSLGQWQRICIARLFMKNAPIFILDEPTASLDIETEVHLLREIVELPKDKICILVSHRMFRKDICDQIIVLSKGEIVEAGDYDSLVAKNGEFSRLWKLYHNMAKKG